MYFDEHLLFTTSKKLARIASAERVVDRVGVAVGARLNCPLSEANFLWAIVCWGPGRCPLYGVQRCPLLGGFKCISIMGSSIGGSRTVRSRGGVRTTEGPLIEVQL